MKNNVFVLLSFCFLISTGVSVHADLKVKQLGNGWIAFTQQKDSFDESIVDITLITKGDFSIRCGELNMEGRSTGFESLSFGAELRYVIDDNAPQNRKGKYSTYLGGSDMVTDSRYYSFKLSKADIDAMKSGTTMKLAGDWGGSGWETKSLNLIGFTSAYDKMCS